MATTQLLTIIAETAILTVIIGKLYGKQLYSLINNNL